MSIERRQRIYLGIAMVLVAVTAVTIALYFSYQAAFEEKRLELELW